MIWDTYSAELDGGGYPYIGPNTVLRAHCYEYDEMTENILMDEFCSGGMDECESIPRQVLLDGEAVIERGGGTFEGVTVKLTFEKI